MDLVDTPTSLKVIQRAAGANMSVDISIGDCHLIRPDAAYSYWCWSDTSTNATVTAASVVNPRIDIVAAWLDLSVTSTTNSNNPGALKFTVVPGTPAGSPVAPTDAAIQAALGSTVPFIKLAQIAVATSASTIVTSNITDIRQPIAFKGRLWGGTSNTLGHTVPNVADDTLALLGATQQFTGHHSFGSAGTPIEDAMQPYVATLTNLTIGSGTIVSKYRQSGKDIKGYIKIVLGSSTISGIPSVTLPVPAHADYPLEVTIGHCTMQDVGNANYPGVVKILTASSITFGGLATASGTNPVNVNANSGADMTASAPFAWGNGDILFAEFSYEAA